LSPPTLLLLPGLLCDRASWAPVLPALERHADCRVPDYANEHSLSAMAERVLADAPATFALAGHSMGGRVAPEVMRRAQRVTRLALDTATAAGLAEVPAMTSVSAGRAAGAGTRAGHAHDG
jgi:pimeloyl-ACP methyl ester carboxylesterase